MAASPAAEGQPQSPGDGWVTNDYQYSVEAGTIAVRSNLFADLHAEIVAGNLKLLWSTEKFSPTATVVARASAAELGHWPARDWHSHPMTWREARWETTVAVEDLDVALVYYVSVIDRGATNLSPMRVFYPRLAGLEEPTRVFWPFLEGFEEGTEGWRLLSEALPASMLQTHTAAKNGLSALLVTVAKGKRSVTVATTRVRGWQLKQELATGLRVWLRTRQGSGRARFTLLANAFTTNQTISVWPKDATLSDHWQKTDLHFSDLPKFALGAIDLFSIEFIANGPHDFLIDDLQLLGPWELDQE